LLIGSDHTVLAARRAVVVKSPKYSAKSAELDTLELADSGR
jgi:hypothetical protein